MAFDKNRYTIEVAAFLVVMALIVTFSLRSRGGSEQLSDHRFMMGTIVSVTVTTADADAGRAAIEAAFDEMERVEVLTTRYSDDSEVSRLNARPDGVAGERVTREVADVVARSLKVAEASSGALDITVAPLSDLWDMDAADFEVPDRPAVDAALERVDWRDVSVEQRTRKLTTAPGTRLDLAASAKGYAVDRAVRALERAGVESGVVDAGGDVGFVGTPPDGQGWRVGIKHPRAEGLLGVAVVEGGSVATSGDYQRFVIIDGVRYHHILDPSTGYPARGVMSVTVAAGLAVNADALATAVFVMGPEEGMALIERTPGTEALIVAGDGDTLGEVMLSSGLIGRFEQQ